MVAITFRVANRFISQKTIQAVEAPTMREWAGSRWPFLWLVLAVGLVGCGQAKPKASAKKVTPRPPEPERAKFVPPPGTPTPMPGGPGMFNERNPLFTNAKVGSRFLALGDSYTIGTSVSQPERWPVQLANLLREREKEVAGPVILARMGWSAEELLTALDRIKPVGPFALVSVQIGVNNQLGGRSVEEFRPALRTLLQRAIALAGDQPGRVLVLSIPDYGVTRYVGQREIAEEVDQFNAVVKEEALRAKARWIDITPISREAIDDLTLIARDELHPSGAMYERWAKEALPAALEAIALASPADSNR